MMPKYLIALLLLTTYSLPSYCGFVKIKNRQHKHESFDNTYAATIQSFYQHLKKHDRNSAINGKFKEELLAILKLLCEQRANKEFCPKEEDISIYQKGYLETSFWGSQSKPYIAFVDEGMGEFYYVVADERTPQVWKVVVCRRNPKVHIAHVYIYNLSTKQLKKTNELCPIHGNRSLFGW